MLDHPMYQYVTYQYVIVYSVRDLCGYLTSVVYQRRPQDISTLKANIRRAINNVSEDVCDVGDAQKVCA